MQYSKVTSYTHEVLPDGTPYYQLQLRCGHSTRYPKHLKYRQRPPLRVQCADCARAQREAVETRL